MTDNPLAELRSALQAIRDARRIVVCPPDLESRIRDVVDAPGVGGLIEVRPSSACPPDQLLIIDPNRADQLRRPQP